MQKDRVLDLEGVHNFRDYGGYPVAGGGRLKRGVLWRSGQHHGATDGDLERIGALGLQRVYDLRSGKERSTHPCRRPADFSAEVLFPDDPSEQHAPHIAAARTPRQRDAAATREGMIRNYGSIAFRPQLVAVIRRYIADHAESSKPSLINCMAGKDRTGIAVAMLHLAAGVHRDDVIEDYLLTNTAGNPAARIASGAGTIRSMSGQLDEDVLKVLMGVEAEYMESALGSLTEKHGSIDGYLRDVLGVDDAMRARLRDQLVED